MPAFKSNQSVLGRRVLSYVVVLSAILGVSQGFAIGTKDGGGGGFCLTASLNHGRPLLIDFAVNSPGLIDPPQSGSRLSPSRATERIGLDFEEMQANPALQLALSRLQLWQQGTNAEIAAAIAENLQGLTVLKTPFRYGRIDRAFLPSGSVCEGRLTQVIRYSEEMIIISMPAWNSLGLQSQAGLLIHEALRRMQIVGLNGSDRDLQIITSRLMLEDPRSKEPLQRASTFFQLNPREISTIAAAEQMCRSLGALGHSVLARTVEFQKLQRTCAERRLIVKADVKSFMAVVRERREVATNANELTATLDFLNDARAFIGGYNAEELAMSPTFLNLSAAPRRNRNVAESFRLYNEYLHSPRHVSAETRKRIEEFELKFAPDFRSGFQNAIESAKSSD